MLPFISSEPLPYNFPSDIVAENGGYFQEVKFPGGTTSVCPANARFLPLLPIFANKCLLTILYFSMNVTILKPMRYFFDFYAYNYKVRNYSVDESGGSGERFGVFH